MRYLHDKAMTDLNFVQVLYQNWQINQKVQRLRTSIKCIITDKYASKRVNMNYDLSNLELVM